MITIFNRKELFSTYDLKKKADWCALLRQHHIDYHIKTVNLNSMMGRNAHTMMGRIGENQNLQIEYIIYVKRAEFEEATAAIYQKD